MIVLGTVAALILLFIIGTYNRLVTLRNRCRNGFSQIDVQLKRRYDLIPNLVESTKGYLTHERDTLEAVMAARNVASEARGRAAANPSDSTAVKGLLGAEGALGSALGRLFAVVESYPTLKGDASIATLMEELTSTENKVSFARQAYNDAVTAYNTTRESFPQNVIASTFGFEEGTLFEISTAAEREAPKVSFS